MKRTKLTKKKIEEAKYQRKIARLVRDAIEAAFT